MRILTRMLTSLSLCAAASLSLCASPSSAAQDAFTDKRDGKTYKTVKIGKQVWFARNLDYAAASSWCYGGEESGCAKYGRLYDWRSAFSACPSGWHLPLRSGWGLVARWAGGHRWPDKKDVTDWTDCGAALKSREGWEKGGSGGGGGGRDACGVGALPGGYRSAGGVFSNAGVSGSWWTSSERRNGSAYIKIIDNSHSYLYEDYDARENAFSVRCVRDY
ncbi:hypothetical protein R80B4_01407 [Fibrobacteres bacterium R8-0-B4]